MGKIRAELAELKDIIKTARIYYKIHGDDRIHTITPLNCIFLDNKVFAVEKDNQYVIKDNISYIHFYKSLFFDSKFYGKCNYIKASSDTKVEITVKDEERYNLNINAKDITIKRENNNGDVIFSAEIKKSSKVIYQKQEEFIVKTAKEVNLQGNPTVDSLSVESASLKVSTLNENIRSFMHLGDEIKLNNIKCNLSKFNTNAKNIDVKNSIIESNLYVFKNCLKPNFVNSIWKVEKSLYYVDGILGKEETGIVVKNDTFNPKESLELRRAYFTYLVSETLRQAQANIANQLDINYKLEEIDKKAEDLMEEYDRQIAILEDKRETIVNGYQKCKVKNLVNKRN